LPPGSRTDRTCSCWDRKTTSDKFEHLVRIGQLKQEPPRADELAGLERSGLSRLADAERNDLAFESRFDLAYNAAHALAL
jgi:hypothetical protein